MSGHIRLPIRLFFFFLDTPIAVVRETELNGESLSRSGNVRPL